MKSRLTVVSILALLVSLLVFSASASAVTWETYLEDIEVTTGTVDFSLIYYHNATGSGNYTNITLPCNAWNLTNASTTFSIHATANQTFNLSVNGNAVNTTSWLNWTLGNYSNTTLSDWGTTETNQFLNFSTSSNVTSNTVTITIVAADVGLSGTWLTTNVTIAESVLAAPSITDEQAYSFWSVKDRIIVNNSLGYTITDLSLNVTYPSHNLSSPNSTIAIATLADGVLSYNNISYQKYGPYVTGAISEDIDEDEHAIIIRVSSHEVLTRLVDWDFDETAEDYEDYFVTLDFDTLEIELNGVDLDWDEGTIEMDDMTLVEGTNKYEFTWTEAAVPAVAAAPGIWDWLFEDFGTGLAVWLWIVIVSVIVCVVIGVAYASKK